MKEYYRVEVSFTRKDLKDIVVDHQPMGSRIAPLKGQPVELYFSENGISGWKGLIQEMRDLISDGQAEFLFSAPSGVDSEKKREFEAYLSQHNFRREDFRSLEQQEQHREERFQDAQRCERLEKWEEAVEGYREAAQFGHKEAQYILGRIYSQTWPGFQNADGPEENAEEAASYFHSAAQQGHAEAEFRFGECCNRGYGTGMDKQTAAEWYGKAAEQGHMEAQFRFGDCYYNGSGMDEDLTAAVRWYRKAAEQGYAKAQFYLGECLFNGEGAEEDKEEAAQWYRKAAGLGYPDAEFSYAQCLDLGQGVQKNKAEAEKWYHRAAEHGSADAANKLKEAELDRTRQVEAARKREEEQRKNKEQLLKREREETARREAAKAAEQEKQTSQQIEGVRESCGEDAGKAMKHLLAHGIDKWDGVWIYPNVNDVDENLMKKLGVERKVDKEKETIFFAYRMPTEDEKRPQGIIMTDRRVVCIDDSGDKSKTNWTSISEKDKYAGVAINRKKGKVYLYRDLSQSKRLCRCSKDNSDKLLTFWQSLYRAARATRKAGYCLEKIRYETEDSDKVEETAKKLLREYGAVDWTEAVESKDELCGELRVQNGDKILYAHNGTHKHDKSGDRGFVITDQAIYFDAHSGREKLTWEEFAYDYYAVQKRDTHENKKYARIYLYKLEGKHKVCRNMGSTPEQKEDFYQFWKDLFKELRG